MDKTVVEKVKAEEKSKENDKVTQEDFKMVTFTLAGRDYALDIMKVKEISKANKFTYVPNAAPFVRGVYNLRGDIISVIDLRIFFNQFNREVAEKEENQLENMIILRLEDHVIAVIVETIEKVVGVVKADIQPPHPLFGDINIKYISGVVEKNERLYVILDVEKIFNSRETSEVKVNKSKIKTVSQSQPQAAAPSAPVKKAAAKESQKDINFDFIRESLETFKLFHPTKVNQKWLVSRYKQWAKTRQENGKDVQFSGEEDARAFLQGFSSPFDSSLWDSSYSMVLANFIDKDKTGNFTVWNPGCGKGAETYSLAVLLKERFPNLLLKILANDNDLISISTAPGLVVPKENLDETYKKHVVEGSNGMQFNKDIKSSIIFEYHDVAHDNNLPPLDMIVMRDLLSTLNQELQSKILQEIEDNLKPGGLLMLGKNEVLPKDAGWEVLEKDNILVYRKK